MGYRLIHSDFVDNGPAGSALSTCTVMIRSFFSSSMADHALRLGALTTFLLKDMWMFGITKSTSELTAVAQTPECCYHLGLGINHVQVAVNGMDGDKRSHLLSLCGQLLKQVLTPGHIAIESSQWIRTTALSYAAEMDGHVLGTLCAVTMALLTNRLDLCIQGLFGAGKIQIHGDPHPCSPQTRCRTQT